MFRVGVTPRGGSSRDKAGLVSLVHGSSILPNGSFYHGNWSRVGNCNNAIPVTATGVLGGSVSRTGGPFGSSELTLHASADAACVSARLDWHGGHVFLRYWARSLAGNTPQVCLWESPVDRCATTSSSSLSGRRRSGWIRYSSIVTPGLGTRSLSLFVYAYGSGAGSQSVDQYAKVQAFSLPSITMPLLTGVPKAYLHARLVVTARGFSSSVSDPRGLKHVLVDGLRNGWITDHRITKVPSKSSFLTAHGALYAIFGFAGIMAVVAGILIQLLGRNERLWAKVREN